MKIGRIEAFKLVVLSTIIILSFHACVGERKSNSSDKKFITSTRDVDPNIDSTSWLKPSKGIRGILEDSKGNLWFSSTDYVCLFDAQNQNEQGSNITYFSKEDGLCGIGRVQEDNTGTIWIESGFAVCSYDGGQFTTHALTPDTTGNKWGAAAHDIWFQKGIPRFGQSEGPPGVYRSHNDKIDFLAFPLPYSENADNIYHPTTGAIQGKDGTIWFGMMEVVIGFKNGVFTLLGREEMGRKDDPRPVGIRGLCVDGKGNLWMADNGSGVFMFNGDTTINFTKLHHLDKDDTKGNTLHRAFAIAEDNAGNMWFGTVYSGIWRYDPSAEQMGKEPLTNFTEKDGVNSESFWTIYKTKNGDLLFCGENPGAVYTFDASVERKGGKSFKRLF